MARFRDEAAAWAKVEREGRCRACGTGGHARVLKPVHTISKRLQDEPWHEQSATLWVNPVSVVPLCAMCDRALKDRRLNLLDKLTVEEELNAVSAAGGILAAVDKIGGVTR